MRNEDTPTNPKSNRAVLAVALKTDGVGGIAKKNPFNHLFARDFLVVFQPLGGGVRPKSQTN